MSRRAVLWIAFAVVHVGVAVLGWFMPNQPMGDVYLVYEKWSGAWFHGGWYGVGADDAPQYVGLVGIDTPWVYPQLALIPMLLAWIPGWLLSYTPGWAVMVVAVDAVAFAVLVGRGRSRGRNRAAAFWLLFLALLGPVALYRIDAVTVPLAILGCLWLRGRPWAASALLAVATWIKVWPAALLAAAVIAIRRRGAVIGAAAAVSATTLAAIAAAGGAAFAFGFVSDQTGRDLQVEAPVSTPYLWDYMLGGSSYTYYDPDLLTFEVSGPGVNPVIAVMTPLLAVAMLVVAGIGIVKVARRAAFAALFPPLALAFVAALIVFNKVGSPQYMVWLVAPVVVGLVLDRRKWRAPAILALVAAAATQIVYPLTYFDLLVVSPLPVVVITIRNIVLVALFAWGLTMLLRVPGRATRPAEPPLAEPALQLDAERS